MKASAAFVETTAKALQKCEDRVVKGKLPQLTDCYAEAKTATAVAKAATKLSSTIIKGCGGKDKACGTGDDEALTNIGWDIGACVNFENGSCTNVIADCGDIATCLQCIGEAAVDQALWLYYDDLTLTDPKGSKAEKALNKCQQAIGKETVKFLVAKSKALQKCWDKINKDEKGKFIAPCPPFGAGDGKAQEAINKAAAKKEKAICKACGGPDKLCNGVGDLTRSEIGFPGECPFVTAPGTNPEPCGKTITTLEDLVNCVDCVTEFKVDCVSLAQSRGVTNRPTGSVDVPDYPAECNPLPTVTPTPTSTPTPTPDCGNAVIDPGEDCDPPGPFCRGGCNPLLGLCLDVSCRADCTCPDPVCGDAIVDAGEECDDGNTAPGDGCSTDCLLEGALCGGSAGTGCAEREFCQFSPGTCGFADVFGVCTQIPGPPCVCPVVFDPVCGCNGTTYGSACEAHCSGVSIAHSGPCS